MKRLVLLFILSCTSIAFFAQANKYDKSKEIGLLAGTAYYLGDVNPYKHFGTQLKTCGGLSFRNNFNKRWTLKTSVLFGQVYAYDSDSDSE